MVEAPAENIDDVVERTREAMREAGEVVLAGFTLRVDAKIVRHPDRYLDERGQQMWETVQGLLKDLQTPCTGALGKSSTPRTVAVG